jgi:hypothetical protein
MGAFRLFEQQLVTQFSRPLLACSFMLRTMIPLTFNAAISNRFASGTFLQCDVIASCHAASCTKHHVVVGNFILVHNKIILSSLLRDISAVNINVAQLKADNDIHKTDDEGGAL